MIPATSNATTAPQPTVEDLHWLDCVRFGAALMVVAIHARGGLWVEWARLAEDSRTMFVAGFFAATRAGTEWVVVFFVLSGFLVGGKLVERLESGNFNVRTYAIDRITRIWVPLVPALIWSWYVAHLVGKPASLMGFAANLAGLQGVFMNSFAGNYPLWSLAYEIWFYLLAGGFAVWVVARDADRTIAGLVVGIGLAVFTKLDVAFLFAWMLGSSTYWLCNHARNPFTALIGGFLIVLGYAFSQLQSATVSLDTSTWRLYVPSASVSILILASGIALTLPHLVRNQPRSKLGIRVDRLGVSLAAFSYTLYLTHYPVLYLWEHFMPGRHAAVDAVATTWYSIRIISCVAFAWLMYIPFEKQTARIRRFLSRSRAPSELRPIPSP